MIDVSGPSDRECTQTQDQVRHDVHRVANPVIRIVTGWPVL